MLNNKIVTVQILRAIACLLVIQYHFLSPLPFLKVSFNGAIGVDIFFVISGFIISASLDTLPVYKPTTTFFINRISRVAPYYYLITVIYAFYYFFFYNVYDGLQITKSFLFIPQIKFPTISLGWSLNHELFFYTAVGLFFYIFKRNHLKTGLCFFLLVSVFSFFYTDVYFFKFVGSSINYTFLLGFFLYTYRNTLLPFFKKKALVFISIIVFAAVGFYGQDYGGANFNGYYHDSINVFHSVFIPRFFIWGIPSFMVVVSFLAFESYLIRFSKSVIVKIGDASYSIYLLQVFPELLVKKYALNTTTWHIVLVSATILISFFMNKIENTIGSFFKNLLKTILIQPAIETKTRDLNRV